ncbi:MAG: DUF2130 domain-containing protein [Alphaproteobacteria bacterium]|nr:DUF2130 domain-containing protein [Alphaproteobacteria bacterium]
MREIKCPKCGTVFTVDESGYAEIVSQIRNAEFEKAVADQIHQHQTQMENEIKLMQMQAKQDKEQSLLDLQKQIDAFKARLDASEKDKQIAVIEAQNKTKEDLFEKDKKIAELENNLKMIAADSELQKRNLQSEYDIKIKMKDEEIAFYKDMKAKMSTKMIGESLEQHCLNEFNKIRSAAFPNAYFEKDNEVVKEEGDKRGSKGDFIFRDYVDGVETVSVMFEMKNEADLTASKHKNEDFFAELDKDRRLKNCEYAVLVSMLESDNDLYNNGIVDVSHRYDKMYVIRPQFFIPMITLLRNAAAKNAEYKKQIAEYRQTNIDVTKFEQEVEEFKAGFGRQYKLAQTKFTDAIQEIDNSIKRLQKVKEALIGSGSNLDKANNKVEELTIKRLTRKSPTVAKMFADNKSEK